MVDSFVGIALLNQPSVDVVFIRKNEATCFDDFGDNRFNGDLLDNILVEFQLDSYLAIGQVQAHQVQESCSQITGEWWKWDTDFRR